MNAPRLVGTRAVIAFGSNLGNRGDTINDAMAEISALPGVVMIGESSLYETVAVKLHGIDLDAPAYLNAAAIVETTLTPHALLAALNEIELRHGRVREERWGDRTLDIDVITYGSLELSDETLTLPHPRAWQRDFVLAPWLELDADATIPGRGRVDLLLASTDDTARRTRSESM
ncbi:2-amino-4-hydroxy-6-hydroxymethyldihydropteridinediphosphokinase [Agreia bicolorata]|uniref:2-amino-4-hydroxy-6-hydroxymethyldihydropteridine diphosphokinase n=1 Tax=Agreia bicolorata TaxID=110935 RepID=A0A1T4XMA6_9MICO|nr:2-amino-4-hydroxy-6-hydroxymethyldihydropteridine diphosphokinase [Agreia bicolorata]KJC65027.1 2-amino-4-hydroxy-6-hydroxymethyldihydropteridine pyrophosphokinase [Agreia bicolorata]SKA90205.1 2-amino-4-hydroxy-6-hydroxymethyldihydropteridinediphosphokinase [Agreia bicolorata]